MASAPDDTLECRLVRIEGGVQGVGYREACVQQARTLGLGGWVRNRLDGSVEVLARGPAAAVGHLVAWLHDGPPLARVQRVTATVVTVPPYDDVPRRFERRPTA